MEQWRGPPGDASTGEGSVEQHGRQPPGDASTGEGSMNSSTTGQASEMVTRTGDVRGRCGRFASAACPVVGGWRAGGAVRVRKLGGPPVCASG